jgi:hypothetical protein
LFTARTNGLVPMALIGTKSFTGAYRLLCIAGTTAICGVGDMSSVELSAGARDEFRRDRAGRARSVLDDELSSEHRAEPLRDERAMLSVLRRPRTAPRS